MKFVIAFSVFLSLFRQNFSSEGYRLSFSYEFRLSKKLKACPITKTLPDSYVSHASSTASTTSTTALFSPSPLIVLRGGAATSSDSRANKDQKEGYDFEDARQALESMVHVGKQVWTRRVVPFFHSRILPVIQHPDTHIVYPLQDFLYNQTMEAQRRREQYYQAGITTASSTVFFTPSRLLKLCVMSWLLTEGLAWTGILWNKDGKSKLLSPKRCKSMVERVRKSIRKMKTLGENNCERVRTWWQSVRENPTKLWTPINSLEPRYQWAVGATVGMILSPTIWSIARSMLKLGVIAFVLGETNRVLFQNNVSDSFGTYYGEEDDKDEGNMYMNLNDSGLWINHISVALEAWCRMVRVAVEHPLNSFELVTHQVDVKLQKDLFMPPNVRKGLFFGVVLGVIAAV